MGAGASFSLDFAPTQERGVETEADSASDRWAGARSGSSATASTHAPEMAAKTREIGGSGPGGAKSRFRATCATALLAGLLWLSACASQSSGPESPAPQSTIATTAQHTSAAQEQPASPEDRTASPTPPAPSCQPLAVDLPELIETKIDVPIPPIEDPSGRALRPFYQRLEALLREKAKEPIRIAVYGDSNMTEDLITGEMRRVLQARYGDAGHGYVALGMPWTWYHHMDVKHGLGPRGWKSYAVSTDPVTDQCYGFGGIAAQSTSRGARAWVATADASAPVGKTVSRLDLFFLRQPKGKSFVVRVDGQELASIETSGPELSTGFRRLQVPDAPHRIGFIVDQGVRLFGVALERDVPGFVVDSLGVGGANEKLLARMNQRSVRQALAHRPYDLIIFLTGATEDDSPKHDAALKKRIKLHQAALPEASLLVMSPPDFAYGSMKLPRPSGRIVRLGRRKRRIATETGCAFWDFHGAMGGKLSIARFAMLKMARYDLHHLSRKGAAYMARRFLYALFRDFAEQQERTREQACGRR